MRAINADELERLNAYALDHHPYEPDHPFGVMKGHAWRDQHWQRLRSTRPAVSGPRANFTILESGSRSHTTPSIGALL
jgi:hypothetical protein